MKKLMAYGSLHGPGQIVGDHSVTDESRVDNSAKCSCSDNVAKQVHIN